MMPYGGSVWVVPAFPASSVRGPAELRSILPLRLPEGRVPSLRSPLSFLLSRHPAAQPPRQGASLWEADRSKSPYCLGGLLLTGS